VSLKRKTRKVQPKQGSHIGSLIIWSKNYLFFMPETTKTNKLNIFHNDCVQNICESEMTKKHSIWLKFWGYEWPTHFHMTGFQLAKIWTHFKFASCLRNPSHFMGWRGLRYYTIIIIFLHGLGRLTCSGIDALPSFPGASTVSSSSRFVVKFLHIFEWKHHDVLST